MSRLIALFLLLSGIASLTYQVTWVRLLGHSMGSTSAAISTVLAAFFLGLALGSYSAEKITRNRINDLRVYISLELVIGLSGLLLLPILLNLDSVMAQLPAYGSSPTAKFLIAMILLAVPTICMGATFPVVAAILIRKSSEVGGGLSALYSINTAGAVLGACLSGFVFIPQWGLDGAIYIAFTLNMAIAAMAWGLNRNLRLLPIEPAPTSGIHGRDAVAPRVAWLPAASLVVLFCTGLVAIASEVGWTKYLAIFTGTTIYGFAAILTVFLIGIAAGSWWIKSRLEGMRNPHVWLAAGLVALGLALLLTRAGLSLVPNIYSGVNYLDAPAPVIYAVKYLVVFLLLIVPTFLFGAIFPLNLKLYCVDLHGVRTRVGRAYAINTLASIIGAILAGFYLIPQFGTDVLLTSGALLILALPLLFLPIPGPGRVGALVAAVASLAVVGLNWSVPHIDYKTMISSVGYKYDDDVKAGRKPEFIFLKEGKAGVISAVSYDGKLARLQNNGLNESMINMKDPTHAQLVEQLLSLIPYFLHEKPRSAFIVGFGGGVTTRALTYTDLESIRVVELEPAIVDAGRAIVKGEIPALQDPRVHLEFNDARNTLLLDATRYDIVAAQASHPWLAGAANVFTKEFFELVRTRLNPGGIYGQWVNLFNMDATTLRAIFKAFFTVFPEGVTFANLYTGDFMLFGSDRPLTFDYARLAARMDNPGIKAAFAHYELRTPYDLMGYFALSRREALAVTTADGPMNTDTNILSEVRLARLIDVPEGEENPYDFLTGAFKFDIMPYLQSDQAAEHIFEIGRVFLRWENLMSARHVVHRLKELSQPLSRALDYETLLYEEKRDEASKLYSAHEQWPDRTHRDQIETLAAEDKFSEAQAILARMNDEKQRRSAAAYLLYQQGQWRVLEALRPISDDERRWHVLGLAHRDINAAGPLLLKLPKEAEANIPSLRALVAYYAARHDDANLQNQARLLVAAIDARIKRLSTAMSSALGDQEIGRASQILTSIERLDPKTKQLDDLRARLAEAKAEVEKNSPPSAPN